MFFRPVFQLNLRGSLGSALPRMTSLIGRNPFCSSMTPKNSEHPRVTLQFEKADGTILKITDRVRNGKTIYDVAADNQIKDEIPSFGLCGGVRACSTCHVIFNKKDLSKVKERTTDEELDLLYSAPYYCETSRMSCCIGLTKEMDGMVLKIPPGFEDQRIK